MISEVLEHLRDKLSPETYCRIDNGFEAEPFEKPGDEVPAVLIYPARFEGDRRASDNRVDQREDKHLGVQLMCRIADFETRRRELNEQLMGYQFHAEARAFEFVEGEPLNIKGGVILFQFIYRCNAPVAL